VSRFVLVLITVFLTLAFEFSNGWHDAANSIATVVSTRVLTPFRAVLWAAFWNFVAAFVFGTAVANTIGKGMVHIELVDERVLLAGLLGAIIWNLITLTLGLPTSSSHALMGGYGGAAVAHAGFKALILHGWQKPVLFIFLSPVIGFIVAILVTVTTTWIVRQQRPRRVDKLVSQAANSFPLPLTASATAPMTRKRNGYHHRGAGGRWLDEKLLRSLLGDYLLPSGDGRRHHGWRVGASSKLWASASPS